MNKIEFKNFPDTKTPISAKNLKLLQDNMEDDITQKINSFKSDLLNMIQNFYFSDNGSGSLYYNLQDLYKTNLIKKEIGYTTSSSLTAIPTYTTVSYVSGSINTGTTGSTIYVWIRLTYSDLGELEFYTDKYGDRYSVYMNSGGGGMACFTTNTLILTDNGLKKISDIKLKEKIMTSQGLQYVTKKYEHITDKIYKITIADEIVKCSFSHPFVTQRGIALAKDLRIGDIVKDINNNELNITNIEIENKETTVYEINTSVFNYYVTNKKILVASEVLL